MVCRVCAFALRCGFYCLHSAKRGASLYFVLRRLSGDRIKRMVFSVFNNTNTTLCSPRCCPALIAASSLQGAGPGVSLCLELFGSGGCRSSGVLRLVPAGPWHVPFQCGARDEFQVRSLMLRNRMRVGNMIAAMLFLLIHAHKKHNVAIRILRPVEVCPPDVHVGLLRA